MNVIGSTSLPKPIQWIKFPLYQIGLMIQGSIPLGQEKQCPKRYKLHKVKTYKCIMYHVGIRSHRDSSIDDCSISEKKLKQLLSRFHGATSLVPMIMDQPIIPMRDRES